MGLQIVKSVLKILNFKQIIIYIFSNLLHIFLKLFGILTILPIIFLLINKLQPKYLIKVSEYLNTDFFLNQYISFYLFILLTTFITKHIVPLMFTWITLSDKKI